MCFVSDSVYLYDNYAVQTNLLHMRIYMFYPKHSFDSTCLLNKIADIQLDTGQFSPGPGVWGPQNTIKEYKKRFGVFWG